ncbi:MAG: MoaD family protein [Anaerolineae bacterium]|nr:MoaD family protein [Anaerolineae bacterium]
MTDTTKSVRLLATVRDIAGSKYISVPFVDGDTVRTLIAAINAHCPALGAKLLDEAGELSVVIHVYVGGRNVEWLDGLDTVIRASDDIFIVPPMAGG